MLKTLLRKSTRCAALRRNRQRTAVAVEAALDEQMDIDFGAIPCRHLSYRN